MSEKTSKYQKFQEVDKHKVAHFISAYVYGNILILAAMISLETHYVHDGHAALLVIGTGLATYIAHVFAEIQEYDVLREGQASKEGRHAALRVALQDARPILSSTGFPALIFILGYWHLLPADLAIQLALWVIVWRIFRIGFIIAKFRGEPATFKLVIRGILLAFATLVIAELKVLLTH